MSEFSVYQWFQDGTMEEVLRFVDARKALQTAMSLAQSIGARMLGTTVRVIITDSGDDCCWEWKRAEGITFPPEVAGKMKWV